MTDSSLAPVALFVYNRLDHTKRTLEALAANYLAPETEVYVFSDGGRDNSSWHSVEILREYLHEFAERNAQEHLFRAFHLIERPENFYLERNIIEGISQVFDHHDTIIVLEDDIVTAQGFLSYMNRAFQLYRDDTQVMHVAGFTHLNLIDEHPELIESDNEAYFTPHMGGWGWGTWRNRWQQHFVHYTSAQEALEGLTNDDIDAMQYGGNFPCLSWMKIPRRWRLSPRWCFSQRIINSKIPPSCSGFNRKCSLNLALFAQNINPHPLCVEMRILFCRNALLFVA